MNNELLIQYLNDFHFIRPKMLWLLVIDVLFIALLLLRKTESDKLKKLIAPNLQPYVIQTNRSWMEKTPSWLFIVMIALLIMALSGPTWKMKELPKVVNTSEVYIALDMSESMLTEDVSPNRLERSKLKVRDLFAEHLNTKIGLVAYAGTPHLVFPPSTDKEIMVPYMNSLIPYIMPVPGTDVGLMLNMVDTLFQKVEAPSTLILFTDDLSEADVEQLKNFRNTTPHFIKIWLSATPQGGYVPGKRKGSFVKFNGDKVLSQPNKALLDRLGQEERIDVLPITLDNSDVELIATHIKQHLQIQSDSDDKQSDWQDEGVWFLIPISLIMLLWFRRGWMIQFCVVISIGVSSCGLDSQHPDWWYTEDYIGQLYLDDSSFTNASQHFESLPNKGYAYYLAGDYEAAEAIYSLDSTATGYYNLGIVLAQMGQYDQSKLAFENALKKDSTFSAAQHSLNKVIGVVDSLNAVKAKNPEAFYDKDGPLNERKAASKDEELSTDTEVDSLPESGDRVTDEVETDKHKYEEMDWPEENKGDSSAPSLPPGQMIMEKTSADPSEFLRKKFLYQKMKYYPSIKPGKKRW